MTISTEDLRKLLDDATPGPWMVGGVRGKLDRNDAHFILRYDAEKKRDEQIAAVWYDPKTGLGRSDALAIATWPDLAAELITARAKIEAAQGALENIIHMGHDCPATFAGDEADWQAVRARLMQSYAKAVLAAWESLK